MNDDTNHTTSMPWIFFVVAFFSCEVAGTSSDRRSSCVRSMWPQQCSSSVNLPKLILDPFSKAIRISAQFHSTIDELRSPTPSRSRTIQLLIQLLISRFTEFILGFLRLNGYLPLWIQLPHLPSSTIDSCNRNYYYMYTLSEFNHSNTLPVNSITSPHHTDLLLKGRYLSFFRRNVLTRKTPASQSSVRASANQLISSSANDNLATVYEDTPRLRNPKKPLLRFAEHSLIHKFGHRPDTTNHAHNRVLYGHCLVQSL